MRQKQPQQGIAIITALLVVALGTITVVAITTRQQFDIQRERNEAIIQTARNFAISGERFAAALLFRDKKEALRENSDSLDDDWAQTIPPVPIDNMTLKGCIVDMQGRFNLNNVVDLEGNAAPIYVDQLTRLLAELNIDVSKAQAIVDWIDKDVSALAPNGAEDDYYTGLEVAYRTANKPMVSVSELMLVKGFSSVIKEEQEDYQLLLPHVATLPVNGGPVQVNVNTATPEVLASLSTHMKPLGADLSRWDTSAYEDYPECEDIFDLDAEAGPETFVAERDVSPYETVPQFETEAAAGINDAVIAPPNSLTVQSKYFQVRIDVGSEDIMLSQYTLLERDDEGRTKVILRARDTL